MDLARDDNQFKTHNPVIHGQQDPIYYPEIPGYSEATATIVEALLDGVRQKFADIKTFTRELLLRFTADEPDESIQGLSSNIKTDQAREYEENFGSGNA